MEEKDRLAKLYGGSLNYDRIDVTNAADVDAVIGLKHNGSSRDTRSSDEQGSARQGYRARQRFFAGSLVSVLL